MPSKSNIVCQNCNRKLLPHMTRPIKCLCGELFDDGQIAEAIALPPVVAHKTASRPALKSHWLPLHQYAVDNTHNWNQVDATVFYDEWCNGIPSYNCSCAANWAEYTKSDPPDFSSADAFFAWSVKAHNFVSANHAVPRKQAMTVGDAWNLYSQPPGPYYQPVASDLLLIPESPKDTLVITVATGEQYERMMLDVTGPYMHQYSQRIGADFIALTGVTQAWWGLEKFRVGQFVPRYKRTLFVDADVLIRLDAPNVFDAVPEGSIGMHDDWRAQGDHSWHVHQRNLLWESQGVPPLHPEYIRSSGVVVCDSMHADIWTPPEKPVPGNHVDEQFWIERWTRFYDNFSLPTAWNTQWYYPDFPITRGDAYFLHFACCPMAERLRQLQIEISSGNTISESKTRKIPPAANWEQFKSSEMVTPYPSEPFDIPEDHSGWSTTESIAALESLAAELSPDQVIVELGSFIGAMSTQAFLRGNPAAKLVCVDMFNHDPKWIPAEMRPFGDTPYFMGEGNVWQHFVNNTWGNRHRIAPMTIDAGPVTLRMIYETGIDVRLVLVDADHTEHAVYNEIFAIAELWPKATIVLDDHTDDWPGVKIALQRARDEGLFGDGDTFELIDGRIMVIRRGQT